MSDRPKHTSRRYRRYATYICGLPEEPVADTTSSCARRELHTPAPTGYLQWCEWARSMQSTHRQVRCPGCGLYMVWVPRLRAAVPA